MKLTKGEFSILRESSKKSLIKEKGINLLSIPIMNNQEIKLILIFDFYLEIIYDKINQKILKVNLAIVELPILFFQ